MKRLFLVLVMVLVFCFNVYAEPASVVCDKFYPGIGETGVIALGASDDTDILTLVRKSGYEGFFSIQPVITGTGVLKIDYQTSNDGVTWTTAVEIIATTVSGTRYPFPATGVNMFCGYIKFKLTETGSANPVTVTSLNLCRQ